MDVLYDQLFYIGKTLEGNSWHDLLNLEDQDRLELLERCNDYWSKQQEEIDTARSRLPRR